MDLRQGDTSLRMEGSIRWKAGLASAVAVAFSSGFSGTSTPAATRTAPLLGHPWAPNQQGYGQSRPSTIDNGGDPTGLVQKIRWTGWGRSRAVGDGISTDVWPGTAVADNGPIPGARVVAFRLGTCRGRPSYNAVEWYFPKYGDTFDPHQYINACTGDYVGASPKALSCPRVRIANSSRFATDVEVIHLSCASASRLIAVAPVARYVRSGGRFVQAGFRCGTSGETLGSAIFDCRLGNREFLYEVAP